MKCYSTWHDPQNQVLDPKDFQHLVGKTREEVEPYLYKYRSYGLSRDSIHYNGMNVKYKRSVEGSTRNTPEDLVIAVEAGHPR